MNGVLRLGSWDFAFILGLVDTSGTCDLGPCVNEPLVKTHTRLICILSIMCMFVLSFSHVFSSIFHPFWLESAYHNWIYTLFQVLRPHPPSSESYVSNRAIHRSWYLVSHTLFTKSLNLNAHRSQSVTSTNCQYANCMST